MPEIIWKRGAEDDLLRTFATFEESKPGGGERFTLQLDGALENLRVYPKMAPIYEAPVRRFLIGKIGMAILYTAEHRGLIVHALIHLQQDPRAIRDRIRRMLDL